MQKKYLVHALIISDNNGRFLVDIIRNSKLDTAHLSGFIGALKMFGEETLGQIKDININGLDIDMIIVSKLDLIFIAIVDGDLPHLNFREGCGRALDVFHKIFQDKIEKWDGALKEFRDFRDILMGQIRRYFEEYKAYINGQNPDDNRITLIENELEKLEK